MYVSVADGLEEDLREASMIQFLFCSQLVYEICVNDTDYTEHRYSLYSGQVTRSSNVSNTNNLLLCNLKNIFQYRSFSKSSTTGLFLTLSVLVFCAFNSFWFWYSVFLCLYIFGPPPPALGTYGFASVRLSVRLFVRPSVLDLKIRSQDFSDFLHKVVAYECDGSDVFGFW